VRRGDEKYLVTTQQRQSGNYFRKSQICYKPDVKNLTTLAKLRASSLANLVLFGPRGSDAGHASVSDELAHVFVGVNDDT
jgi:hypothetical protein